jgi:hypothetical protein
MTGSPRRAAEPAAGSASTPAGDPLPPRMDPPAGHLLAMPAQQRRRDHEERAPACAGQQPRQHGKQRPIRRLQTRPPHLPAQHRRPGAGAQGSQPPSTHRDGRAAPAPRADDRPEDRPKTRPRAAIMPAGGPSLPGPEGQRPQPSFRAPHGSRRSMRSALAPPRLSDLRQQQPEHQLGHRGDRERQANHGERCQRAGPRPLARHLRTAMSRPTPSHGDALRARHPPSRSRETTNPATRGGTAERVPRSSQSVTAQDGRLAHPTQECPCGQA